ncbi:hypothetical protein [Lutispora thermophila]|nr:hypothetical protein [Lutispora thermophila]
MYFNDELVRYFWDGVESGNNASIVNYEYLNEDGVIDVHTIRKVEDNGDGSINPFGDLIGIVKYTQEEFAQRNLDDLKGYYNPVTYVMGDVTSEGKTFAEMFAEYKAFGIEYKELQENGRGNVYYNGQLVKKFIDENKAGGIFTYESVDGGQITVHTIYDQKGKLIGVEKQ